MQLPSELSRLISLLLSPIKRFNYTRKKKQFQQLIQSLLHKVSWKSPLVIGSLSIIIVTAGGLTYYFSTTTPAVSVIVNGKQLGFVPNLDTGKTFVESALQENSKYLEVSAKTHDQITYENVRVNKETYSKSVLQQKDLEVNLSSYVEAYQLEVNGSVIAILPTQEAIDKVLEDYQNYYAKPSTQNKVSSVSYVEKVASEKTEVPPSKVQSPDQVLKQLVDGKSTNKDYTIEPNDSWWLIARKNNMSTEEVLASNPGATEDTQIKPGQIIKLVSNTPYFTVVSKGTYTSTEPIPYDTKTKTDYSLRNGQTKVVTQGSNGTKSVTYSYVQNNGKDIKKEVLDEKVTQAPVTKVVAQGPAARKTQVALGISRGSGDSSTLVNRALSLVGTPYVWGGTTRDGFDCSGFTQYIYSWSGISIPRSSYAQYASGDTVSKSNLEPGDLVFFTTYSKGASHVGIYIGGGRFVHADNPSRGVATSSLSESYYAARYLGARRY